MIPLELSPTISLHQRLLREEDPRTIALAIRTFKRASIDKTSLSCYFKYENWNDIEHIIDDIILLSKSNSFDKLKFVEKVNSLTPHLLLL